MIAKRSLLKATIIVVKDKMILNSPLMPSKFFLPQALLARIGNMSSLVKGSWRTSFAPAGIAILNNIRPRAFHWEEI